MAELLTLLDLTQFTTGTTSELTQRIISGFLSIATNEDCDEERGTISLIDQITKIKLICLIDFLTPQLLNIPVYINRWVYVNNEELGIQYIEIQMSHIYKDVACSQSLLSQSLQLCARKANVCIENNIPFNEPSLFLSSSMQSPTNMTGIVSAISILFVKPDSPASFFIQLVNTTKEPSAVTASIMFHGDSLIKYYRYFQIGVAYTFESLDLAIVGEPAHTLFSFIDTQSVCNMITLDQFYNEITIKNPSFLKQHADTPPLLISEHTAEPNSTYTGRITRVIDSLFGIYELDRKFLVCLFHYLGYSPSTPYRVNTLLRLHHVHAALIQPEDGRTSHLFQSLWHAPLHNPENTQYMVLVACVKSHVNIIDMSMDHIFSPESDLLDTQMRDYIYIDSLKRHCDFSNLIRQLEIYAALSVKFGVDDFDTFKHAYTQIRDLTFARTRSRTKRGIRNFVHDFFKHETLCVAVTNNPIIVESYPFLSDVQASLEQRLEEVDLRLPGTQENRFDRGHVNTQVAQYQLTDAYCILGQIKASGDGRLYLADNASRVLLMIHRTTPRCQVGDLYMVKKCKWVKENLSSLWCTYMVVQERSFVSLNLPCVRFQVASRAKRFRLTQARPEFKSLMAFYVVDKYPIKMMYDAEGQVYLTSRVVVQWCPVEGYSEPEAKGMIVLTSKRKSLKWDQDVRVGTLWMVEGPIRASLDVDQHLLFPISIGDGDAEAIRLEPVMEDNEEVLEKVYNVSDLLLPELQSKVNSFFYEKAVCVQGVVVHKRFTSGYKTYDSSGQLALYEQLGVGTGKFNRKLFIQLREMNGIDVLNVYMDVDRVHYPLGMIVGSVIRIRHLIRRGRGDAGVYGIVDDNACIEIMDMEPPALFLTEQKTRTIASFLDPVLGYPQDESEEIFKLFVYTQSIMSLTMKWVCQECGSAVHMNECYGMCENAPRVFMANAYVQVSDGTSHAHVSVDGEHLVFSLLQLTIKQADALKTIATNYGEISYGNWESIKTREDETQEKAQRKELHGYTLTDLCDKAVAAGQFWLFGKSQMKESPASKKRLLELESDDMRGQKRSKINYIEELKLQRVSVADNGRLIRTLELKKLKLKAINLEYPEARLVAYDMLK